MQKVHAEGTRRRYTARVTFGGFDARSTVEREREGARGVEVDEET